MAERAANVHLFPDPEKAKCGEREAASVCTDNTLRSFSLLYRCPSAARIPLMASRAQQMDTGYRSPNHQVSKSMGWMSGASPSQSTPGTPGHQRTLNHTQSPGRAPVTNAVSRAAICH